LSSIFSPIWKINIILDILPDPTHFRPTDIIRI
jgi:hypothetical protein